MRGGKVMERKEGYEGKEGLEGRPGMTRKRLERMGLVRKVMVR